MKKTTDNQECKIWENTKGESIIASRADTMRGVYWTVEIVYGVGDFETLGTRCTWEKVMQFVNEYDY